jgi:hypothetical protein
LLGLPYNLYRFANIPVVEKVPLGMNAIENITVAKIATIAHCN